MKYGYITVLLQQLRPLCCDIYMGNVVQFWLFVLGLYVLSQTILWVLLGINILKCIEYNTILIASCYNFPLPPRSAPEITLSGLYFDPHANKGQLGTHSWGRGMIIWTYISKFLQKWYFIPGIILGCSRKFQLSFQVTFLCNSSLSKSMQESSLV